MNNMKFLKDDTPTLIEKKNDLQGDVDNIDNSINNIIEIKLGDPESVQSPFVCTMRVLSWKSGPQKRTKLSELYDKYEDDTVANKYRKNLDRKTIELQNKVKYWTELSSKSGSDVPQSVKDEIDVACKQTKLLTTDKFMQMQILINEYDNKFGRMLITTDDLDGFWDMLLLQVEKLDGQFSQLDILQKNNWAPLTPIAEKGVHVIIPSGIIHPVVKSKIAGFNKNTSSTSTSSNPEYKFLVPVLSNTMEISYATWQPGMARILQVMPRASPLKPALKNPENEKGTKSKNIQFNSPKEIVNGFLTPENSCNVNTKFVDVQDRKLSIRHSDRLANKPLKRYKR